MSPLEGGYPFAHPSRSYPKPQNLLHSQMAKTEQKTKPSETDVTAYIDGLPNEADRDDSRVLDEMMSRISGEKAVLWGGSMVGYGRYAYKYDSGHSGEAFLMGFAPRKTALTLYGSWDNNAESQQQQLLEKLGKHKLGKSCLYIKRLKNVDLSVLEQLIENSWANPGIESVVVKGPA